MALLPYWVSALANSSPLNHPNSALCTKRGLAHLLSSVAPETVSPKYRIKVVKTVGYRQNPAARYQSTTTNKL